MSVSRQFQEAVRVGAVNDRLRAQRPNRAATQRQLVDADANAAERAAALAVLPVGARVRFMLQHSRDVPPAVAALLNNANVNNGNVAPIDAVDVDNNVAPVNGDGDVQRSQEPSWIRLFFKQEIVDGVQQMRCLLDPLGDRAINHKATVVDDNTTMHDHLKSIPHKSAMAHYNELKADGKSAAVATELTIQWAKTKAESSKISFARTSRRTVDERVKRMQSEVALACFVAERGVSLSAVTESVWLDKFLDVYGMRHTPDRSRFGDAVTTAYSLAMKHRGKWLDEVDFFSITIDAATLKFQSATRYVALTLHAVLPSFELKSCALALITVNESHTWRNLSTAIATRLENTLPHAAMLVTTVTDQGANMIKTAASLHNNLDVAAVEQLGPGDWDEPLPGAPDLDPTSSHVCVCHRVHNCALDLYNAQGGFIALVDKVRAIVVYVRGSPIVAKAFADAQHERLALLYPNQPGKQQPRKLVLDVKTRWISIHEMLDVFVGCYPDLLKIALSSQFDKFDGEFVTVDEHKILLAMVKTLAPAAQFINDLEGQKYVSIALVPVYLARLMHSMMFNVLNDDEDVQSIKRRFRQSLEVRLGHILTKPNLALAAAALHPSFGHLQFVTQQARDMIWGELAKWCIEFPRPAPLPIPGCRTAPPPVMITQETYIAELRQVRNMFEANAPHDMFHADTTDNDPLLYWRALERDYRCAFIARIVFGAPASSAPRERVFSLANLIATQTRANLDDFRVEQLVLLRQYLTEVNPSTFFDFCKTEIEAADKAASARKRPAAAFAAGGGRLGAQNANPAENALNL